MCMMAAPLMLGAVSGVAGFIGDQAAYKQSRATKRANDANAIKATLNRYDALNVRIAQEKAAASSEAQEGQREGLKARATERASQAEAGVTGLSTDAALADLFREEGEFRSGVQTSLGWKLDNLEAEGAAAQAQGQSQINSVATPNRPSFLAAGIRILGNAASNYPQIQ